LDLAVPGKDLALVEWDLQSPVAMTVANVSGPDVLRWQQSGQRLTIWLERSSDRHRLELTGWVPLTSEGSRGRLELPGLRIRNVQTQQTTYRLRADSGWRLVTGPLRGLHLMPALADELVLQGKEANSRGVILVSAAADAAAVSAGVQMLTFLEPVEDQLHLTAGLAIRMRTGEGRRITVRLRDWEGENVEVRGAGLPLSGVGPPSSSGRDRAWIVDLPAGPTRCQVVTLRSRLPLAQVHPGMWMPEVRVIGERQQLWLAIAGKDLTADTARGLIPESNLGQIHAMWRLSGTLDAWASEAERLRRSGGRLWRARGLDWSLALHQRSPRAGPTFLQVFLHEQIATVPDGRHWRHEVSYWIGQLAEAGVLLRLPAGASVLTVWLNGVETAGSQPDSRSLWVPIPGPGRWHHVRVRYHFAAGLEKLERPVLDPALAAGAPAGPVLWTIEPPPGCSLQDQSGQVRLDRGHSSAAMLALYRAAAQERMARASDPNLKDQRRLALARIAWYCRLAEHDLLLAGEPSKENLEGLLLTDWLAQLTETLKQARRPGDVASEGDRAEESERMEWSAEPPYLGVSSTSREVPTIHFVDRTSQRTWMAVIASGEWLGLLAVIWIVTLMPLVSGWLRELWPEQLAILAGLVWLAGGALLAVLAVLAVAVLARLGLVMRLASREHHAVAKDGTGT
jgi:hypothetical protein